MLPVLLSLVLLAARGTVVNSVTGEPVRRALVRINGVGEQRSGFTGSDGRFEIDGVAAGQLVVTAQKPGFFTDPSMSRRLSFGPATGDLLVKLTPTASIEGRIVDGDGEPIEDVPVQILVAAIVNGRKQWQPRGGASTDENGAYRADDLEPGTYLVHTSAHPLFGAYLNIANEKREPQVYAPEFYPGASGISSAQPIQLEAGASARADLTLSAVPAATVSGTISGMRNGVSISCEDSDGQQVSLPLRFDFKSGKFAMQIPAGSWRMQFIARDEQGRTYYAELPVSVSAADVNGLDVVLQPLPSIPVDILNETDQQGTGAAQVHLQLVTNTQQFGNILVAQPDASGGSLAFHDVMPGTYTVSAQANGAGCVDSIQAGSTDLTREELTVLPGSQPEPIEVTLLEDCASLSGSVSGADAPVNGMAILVPESSALAPMLMPVQPGGKFQFQNVRPASYRVYAFSDVRNLEYANPDALRDFPSQEVSLGAGQKAQVEVELISRTDK